MAALSEVVKDPAKRRAVVDDCTALIDAEVGDKRGLTGVAIKAAYMTVKNIKPGFIASAMNDLLDPFSQKVDPFWADFAKHDGKSPFLSRHLADTSRTFTEMMFALSVLDLPFDHVLPSHGAPVKGGARGAYRPRIEELVR